MQILDYQSTSDLPKFKLNPSQYLLKCNELTSMNKIKMRSKDKPNQKDIPSSDRLNKHSSYAALYDTHMKVNRGVLRNQFQTVSHDKQ